MIQAKQTNKSKDKKTKRQEEKKKKITNNITFYNLKKFVLLRKGLRNQCHFNN